MEVKASLKHLRTSPRKTRLVVDLIRGLEVDQALNQLRFINKRAADPISKLLSSAISNAENNFELEKANLFVKEIRVDEASTIKRWMPRAHGRATPLRKRGSHILITLGEIKDSGKKKAKVQEIEKPLKLQADNKGESAEKITKKTKKEQSESATQEKGKEINDSKRDGRGGSNRGEGKGFSSKVFRRKAG